MTTLCECECDLCQRRRGCFAVEEPDFDPPDGWVEVQRDDSPDVGPAYQFDSDAEAAMWVSAAARVLFPDTGVSVPAAALSPEMLAGRRWRAIAPVLDAIDIGLLPDGWSRDGC